MLKVTEIASYLEVELSTVYNYIYKEQLKAIKKKDGIYYIEIKDFNDFIDNYFHIRHKRKGVALPTVEDFEALKKYLNDIESSDIDWFTFQKKYAYIKLLIPPNESCLLLKRNNCIVIDYQDGMDRESIAKKYELSKRSIDEILRKKEDFNLA